MTGQKKNAAIDEAIKLIERGTLAVSARQFAVAAECMKQAFAIIDNLPKEEINANDRA